MQRALNILIVFLGPSVMSWPLAAQTPQHAARYVGVEQPTVVAFAKSREDTVSAGLQEHRDIAEHLGFVFTVAIGPRLVILDVEHKAVHYVPEDASSGFILIVPGRRSDLIRGFVDSEHFQERLRTYLAAVRPLRLGLK